MDTPRGYIGLTDPDWYTHLSALLRVDEVNFWQPHGNRAFRALNRGGLFFFKLRAPQRDIVGFGFFERYESLPAWLAWQCFEQLNGAATIEDMIDRILRLRREANPMLRAGDFSIGCIMLSAPVFFPREEWVRPPNDWSPTGIQQGKAYDLGAGEGGRVLNECFERAERAGRHWNVDRDSPLLVPEGARYGPPIQVRPRIGQGLFSLAVRDAYGGACAVTREHSQPALDAAHIKPYSLGGEHRVDNGLFLRSDLHRLYDRGYVTVTPDYVFRVGERLRDEFKNGRSYYSLNGSRIAVPEPSASRPNREFLDWHQHSRFKG